MLIPFFVVDRPVSLEILKGFFAENLEYKFGILTHAFVSDNFKNLFKSFPYKTSLKYYESTCNKKDLDNRIKTNIIKIVDSGIFQAKRDISYEELFAIYEYMNADYGIIIDFLKDKERTLKSAKEAMKIYKKKKYKFELVGVAQGKTQKEYIECYKELQNLGYKKIAIGGLLKRNGTSNYMRLFCEEFLRYLLEEIRKVFNPSWIFTLGIYHPNRHKILEKYGVWGADYKGWIFNYEEDYSFIKTYLEAQAFVKIYKKDKEKLLELLNFYKKAYKTKNRDTLKNLRKEIENVLTKYNLSLQFFRFQRIRENLNKNIVENLTLSSLHTSSHRGLQF